MTGKIILFLFSTLTLVIAPFASLSVAAPSNDVLAQDDTDLSNTVVYFAESNTEATRFDRGPRGVSRYAGLLAQLGMELYTLEWNSGIPDDADLIVIPGPDSDLTPDQVARLWLYINQGGRVLMVVDAFSYRNGEISSTNRALAEERGFFELAYPDFGLRPQDNVLLTENDSGGDEEDSGDSLALPFTFEFTTEAINTDHPITEELEGQMFFSGARSLELDMNTPNLTLTPLVFTDDTFYGETTYDEFIRDNVAIEYNIGVDVARGQQALALALESDITDARVVLLSDVDMINNGGGFQSAPSYSSNFVYPANIQFALNATTWLLDEDAPELSFPSPQSTSTPTTIPTPTITPTPEATPSS